MLSPSAEKTTANVLSLQHLLVSCVLGSECNADSTLGHDCGCVLSLCRTITIRGIFALPDMEDVKVEFSPGFASKYICLAGVSPEREDGR